MAKSPQSGDIDMHEILEKPRRSEPRTHEEQPEDDSISIFTGQEQSEDDFISIFTGRRIENGQTAAE